MTMVERLDERPPATSRTERLSERRAPAEPIGPSPVRRARSVRRTSTIDTSWPGGLGQPMVMRGRARDIVTEVAGAAPIGVGEDWMRIRASPRREIIEIATGRLDARAQTLIGRRGGGALRGELAALWPEELAAGSPLNLLLDDFSGASLVAGWAWSRWTPAGMERARLPASGTAGRNGVMADICSGFRAGASGLRADGSADSTIQSSAIVPPLPREDDPLGWHALAAQEGVGARRARRIDAWLEDGLIRIDACFQDSATNPAGGPNRIAVHEYRLAAAADPESHELLAIEVDPRVLPYKECSGASPNVSAMIGTRLGDLRLEVPRRLSGTLGCTHLNDVLRALSDVPLLVAKLAE